MALSGVALVLAGVATPVQGAVSAPQARADVQPYRTGHPPTLASAVIDAQRRLVVTYTAPDGMTFGGHVYLDNDPRDAAAKKAHDAGKSTAPFAKRQTELMKLFDSKHAAAKVACAKK